MGSLPRWLCPPAAACHGIQKFAVRCLAFRNSPAPDDPQEGVVAREIGTAVRLTLTELFEIEDAASDFGRQQGWTRKANGGKEPYNFVFRTITCFDKTDEEVTRERKRRSNERYAAKLKANRLERAMQTNTHTAITTTSYASLRDAIAENVTA
jgi:hypothetical protein